MINEFRTKILKLRPVTYLSGSYNSPLDIPYAYIWSPNLVPKPKGPKLMRFVPNLVVYGFFVCCADSSKAADWGPNVDVVGFCFLDLASNYVPPDSLVEWLNDDKEPIYIWKSCNYYLVSLPILFIYLFWFYVI